MNSQNRRYLMLALEFVLVAYFGWRSYDFVTASLTGVSETVTILIGVIYVLATDVSFLLWRHVAAPTATTRRQHSIADAMAWILMALTVLTSAGDVLLHNRLYTIDAAWLGPVLLFLPVATVGVNLIGLKLFEDSDADRIEDLNARAVEFAENELSAEVHRAAIVEVRRSRAELAGKLAPHIAADVRNKVTDRTFARLPTSLRPAALDTGKPAPTAARTPAITPEPITTLNAETDLVEALEADGSPNGQSRRNGRHS